MLLHPAQAFVAQQLQKHRCFDAIAPTLVQQREIELNVRDNGVMHEPSDRPRTIPQQNLSGTDGRGSGDVIQHGPCSITN